MAEQQHPKCGANRKGGRGVCNMAAGLRTDHPGVGRCWLHGGRNQLVQVTHGRYSQIKTESVAQLLEKHRNDPDPFNVRDDLALLRALIEDFISRNTELVEAILAWNAGLPDRARPARVPDIIEAASLLDLVSKTVERVEKTRSANHISRADFARIMQEYWRAIDALVTDDAIKAKIRESWLSVRL